MGYEYDVAMGSVTRAYTTNSDIRYGYDSSARLQTVTVLKRNGATLAQPEVIVITRDQLLNRSMRLLKENIRRYRRSIAGRLSEDNGP